MKYPHRRDASPRKSDELIKLFHATEAFSPLSVYLSVLFPFLSFLFFRFCTTMKSHVHECFVLSLRNSCTLALLSLSFHHRRLATNSNCSRVRLCVYSYVRVFTSRYVKARKKKIVSSLLRFKFSCSRAKFFSRFRNVGSLTYEDVVGDNEQVCNGTQRKRSHVCSLETY